MVLNPSHQQVEPDGRLGLTSRVGKRSLDAVATGLAAGGMLGLIDAAGYLAGFGTDEWPQILSFSMILSVAIYLPATLAITLLLLLIPRLRRDGVFQTLRLILLFAAALALTNLNRLLVAVIMTLQTGKANLQILKANDAMRYSPLVLLTVLLIAFFVGRYGLWRLRRVWTSTGFVRLVYGFAGLAIIGVIASGVCLARTSFRLGLADRPAVAVRRPPKPHVVILVLDTVRADTLSCYGGPAGATPHLHQLAQEGTLFENVLSPGVWTLPSHASMFTGLAASEHGVGWGNMWLEDRFVTFPEELRAAGYQTVAISCNPMLSKETNLFQGFDEIYQQHRWLFRYSLLGCRDVAEVLSGSCLEQWFPGMWAGHLTERGALSANVRALGAIARAAATGRPLFLFVNYIDPHLPYVPPRPYRRRLGERAYQASYQLDQTYSTRVWPYMLTSEKIFSAEDIELLRRLNQSAVSYLDSRVGEIVAVLDHYGLTRDTLLIITSDHGENIGERGLLDHQFCVYQTLLRVPLIVRFPDRLPSGRVKTPVQTTDICPTVLAVAGVDAPTNPQVARSLLQAPNDDCPRPRVAEYLESVIGYVAQFQSRRAPGGYRSFLRRFRAIELDGYKFIWSSDGDHELYFLPEDPGEQNNLIESEPQRAETLHKQLNEWLASIERYRPPRKIGEGSEMSEELKERLRTLGYL